MSVRYSLLAAAFVAAALGLVAGCATREPAPQIDSVQARYEATASAVGLSGGVAGGAAGEAASEGASDLDSAQAAISAARQAHEANDALAVQYQVAVANQHLDIVDAHNELASIRNEIDRASEQRQELLLQARTREAESAHQRAEGLEQDLETREAQIGRLRAEAAALADELEVLEMREDDRGMVLSLSDIVFEVDSSDLKPGAESALVRLAEFLQQHEDREVQVQGFTDAVGEEAYNQQLSLRRAEAVAGALRSHGVDGDRISTHGMGEADPVATNDTDVGRQLNRRVEIIIENDEESVGAVADHSR